MDITYCVHSIVGKRDLIHVLHDPLSGQRLPLHLLYISISNEASVGCSLSLLLVVCPPNYRPFDASNIGIIYSTGQDLLSPSAERSQDITPSSSSGISICCTSSALAPLWALVTPIGLSKSINHVRPYTREFQSQKGLDMWNSLTCKPRCFAFMTIETSEEADTAITLNTTEIMERSLVTVEKARRGRARMPTPSRYYGLPRVVTMSHFPSR